jgi:hypothetical protein
MAIKKPAQCQAGNIVIRYITIYLSKTDLHGYCTVMLIICFFGFHSTLDCKSIQKDHCYIAGIKMLQFLQIRKRLVRIT